MLPILYSFRRCPYAIRARMALCYSGIQCELREVVLRDKAPEFLQVSPSGTVPTLVLDHRVLDESFDIMLWALEQSDPMGWLDMPEAGSALVEETDSSFKNVLDRTKYASRYPEAAKDCHLRTKTEFIDKAWFDVEDFPSLHHWLESILASELFLKVMPKYPRC